MGAKERGSRRQTPAELWRVFLSHTSDLGDYPKDHSFVAAAQSAVIRAGHAVTDMAYFTARDNEPTDYCEGMVADASVFVCIVGQRYGTPVRGRPDRSYTELEYDTASRLGRPRLVFMTREDTGSLPTAEQPADHASRQRAFRQRLLDDSKLTVAWIGNPHELEIGLYQALVELKQELSRPKDDPNNLRALRRSRAWSQEEVAHRCRISASTYQTWENGTRRPQPENFRALCNVFDVDVEALGFDEPSDSDSYAEPAATRTVERAPRIVVPGPFGYVPAPPAAIQESQDNWRLTRRHLAANAARLTRTASELYPHAMKVASTPLLTREDWMAAQLVDLANLRLTWIDGEQRKRIAGAEPEARLLFPLRAPGHQYASYTDAVRYLDRPALFENRPTYRLLDANIAASEPGLSFSLAMYFDMIDVSQAVAHELAAVHERGRQRASLDQLPFRSLIGDPFDIRRRPVQAAINAITLRRDTQSGAATFLLHWRDPAKVAVGGGMFSVMPVGVFQPSTVDPWGQRVDFDPWRNLVREFSEEFLGMPEHDGSAGARINYERWELYRTLTGAREARSLRVHCFGLGVDPLALGIDLLTAVVIDSDVFDEVFGDRVQVNAEGHVVASDDGPVATVGFPFTEESVQRFVGREPMGPGGAACLALAWQHREALL
jgi:transcriptional regulator with XRE-family HTH domain